MVIETRNKKGKLIAVALTKEEQHELALKNNRALRKLKEAENHGTNHRGTEGKARS